MDQEFMELANGDVALVICASCRKDLRLVGIINECKFIAQYEYHWEGRHFDGPEEPDLVLEEYFCAACKEPIKVENREKPGYWYHGPTLESSNQV